MRIPHLSNTNALHAERQRPDRTSRRAFVATACVVAAGAPLLGASAQEPPPIEPADRDGQGSGQVIEPDVAPTSAPDEPAEAITAVTNVGQGRYFAETGHNLDAPFLTAWEVAGGADGPGLPLSEPRYSEADGGIRQDFEGMALLHRPDAGERGTIGGLGLPRSVIQDIGGRGSGPVAAEGVIGLFWRNHGGVQLLGEPQSAAVTTGSVTVQAFASAVLERDASGTVTLRPVNREIVANLLAVDAAFLPAPPTNGTSFLVTAEDGLFLRSGAFGEAEVVALLPDNAEFIAANTEAGDWVPGYVDGFAGWVSGEYLATRSALPDLSSSQWRQHVWSGATLGDSLVRNEPTTASPSLRTIPTGDPVVVTSWVRGEAVVENQITWAKLEDGGFIYARNIGRSAPVEPSDLPANAPSQGKWIDVDLTQQLMVAYEGRTPVRTLVTTTGMPGWETPVGLYAINTRVANETMESGSIGAESFYVLKDVLFTQYFTDRGHALHFAWWKNAETIGRPGSHGCLNLLLEDAQFFWDWAGVGTPVLCR